MVSMDLTEENDEPEKIVHAAPKPLYDRPVYPQDITNKYQNYEVHLLKQKLASMIYSAVNGSPLETFSELDSSTCTRVDIYNLLTNKWLNDTLLNFYFDLIQLRGNDSFYPSVYAFSTFFYASLCSRGPVKMLKWTARIKNKRTIFDFDILFVPLHFGCHWALASIHNDTKKIKYYDSIRFSKAQCLKVLQDFLMVEQKDKKVMEPEMYEIETMENIPRQTNNYDCGMFTLKYAEYISRNVPITFDQSQMPYYRKKMVVEIFEKTIL